MKHAAEQLSLFSTTEEPDTPSGFSVRESHRAKRLSIKVFPRGRVEVVVPKRTRVRDVEAFVAEHREWIRKTRAAYALEHPPEAFQLPTRIHLAATGRTHGVVYEPRDGLKSVRFRETGDVLRLYGRTGDETECVRALRRWLAAAAREAFEPGLRALAAETGNAFSRMQVRGQKTCWGSHSSSGTISLNYCLLFLRPELVRYLMIHELCHARHMNHSQRFWRLVARFEPAYRKLDRELSAAWKDIPVWVGLY